MDVIGTIASTGQLVVWTVQYVDAVKGADAERGDLRARLLGIHVTVHNVQYSYQTAPEKAKQECQKQYEERFKSTEGDLKRYSDLMKRVFRKLESQPALKTRNELEPNKWTKEEYEALTLGLESKKLDGDQLLDIYACFAKDNDRDQRNRSWYERTKTLAKSLSWPAIRSSIQEEVERLEKCSDRFDELRKRLDNAIQRDSWTHIVNVERSVRLLKNDEDRKRWNEFRSWLAQEDHFSRMKNECWKCSRSPPSWVLQHDVFKEWAKPTEHDTKWLWGLGAMGVGKTTIASLVARHLLEESGKYVDAYRQNHDLTINGSKNYFTEYGKRAAVAIYYCNEKASSTQDSDAFMRTICRQILEQISNPKSAIHIITEFESDQGNQDNRSSQKIHRLCQDLLENFSSIYVVVDAVDESYIATDLIDQLKLLSSARMAVRVFVTSRTGKSYIPAFPDDLKQNIHDGVQKLDLHSEEQTMREYIAAKLSNYVEDAAADESKPVLAEMVAIRINDGTLQQLIDEVIRQAQGVFLFVELQLSALEDCDSKGQLEARLHAPATLDIGDRFEDALHVVHRQVRKSHRKLGMRVLMWVIHARRLLNLAELRQVLAMYNRKAGQDLDDNERPSRELIDHCTNGLLFFEKSDNGHQLVRIHKGFQDYCDFPSQKAEHFPDAEVEMARICLEFLMLKRFSGGDCKTESQWSARLSQNPFLGYAAGNWGYHVAAGPERLFLDSNSPFEILHFLESENQISCVGQALQLGWRETYRSLLRPDDLLRFTPSNHAQSYMTALHIVSYFGLHHITEALLDRGHRVDARSYMGVTALHLACWRGKERIVKLLLSRGADPDYVNHQGDYVNHAKQSCLHTAAVGGLTEIVCILTKTNRQTINRLNWHNNTPLIDALSRNHGETALALLDLGANPDILGAGGVSALQYAAEAGCAIAMPRLISDMKLLRNPQERSRRTHDALDMAIWHHRHQAVEVLLTSYSMASPWQMRGAAERNNVRGIQLVAEHWKKHGLSISRDDTIHSPITAAVKSNSMRALQELIRLGAFPDTETDGSSPLHHVAIAKFPSWPFVEPLLDRNPDLLNKLDQNKLTPLWLSIQFRKPAVFEKLLSANADPMKLCRGNLTAISAATEFGALSFLERLLRHPQKKAMINWLPSDGKETPLESAAKNGHASCVDILLKENADSIPKRGGRYFNCLHHAAKNGHLEAAKKIVHHLSNQFVDVLVNTLNQYSRTALNEAVEANHYEVVELCLGSGARQLVPGMSSSPLHEAARSGNEPMVHLLINKSENHQDLLSQTSHIWKETPMHLAAALGKMSLVNYFHSKGARLDVVNAQSRTPLHTASKGSAVDTVKALLDLRADSRAQDMAGITPLHLAAGHAPPEVLNCLLENAEEGCVLERDNTGSNILHHAASRGRPVKTRRLINHALGKRLSECRRNDGLTARDLALLEGHENILNILDNTIPGG